MMPLQEIVWASSFNRVRFHEVAERKYKNSWNRRQAGQGLRLQGSETDHTEGQVVCEQVGGYGAAGGGCKGGMQARI